MGSLTTLGGKTKTTFLHSENHKTTFEATAAAALKKGQPVKLDADGKVSAWAKTDLLYKCVGYCYGDVASGEVVTIWSRGYAIIYGLSTAALDAGPVAFEAYNSATDIDGATGYSEYANSATAAENNGWALDQADADNELVRVLLMD